jgi:hypothetical protein
MDPAADIAALLWHFGHQLPDDRQVEFCRAAQDALSRLRCLGPGSAYRALVGLLPGYFIPPIADDDHHQGARRHRRFSKLADGCEL